MYCTNQKNTILQNTFLFDKNYIYNVVFPPKMNLIRGENSKSHDDSQDFRLDSLNKNLCLPNIWLNIYFLYKSVKI